MGRMVHSGSKKLTIQIISMQSHKKKKSTLLKWYFTVFFNQKVKHIPSSEILKEMFVYKNSP